MKSILKRIASLSLTICLCSSLLVSCAEDTESFIPTPDAESITLKVGVLGGADGIIAQGLACGEAVLLPGGQQIKAGELKILWRELADALGVELAQVEADAELENCDLVIGSITGLDRLSREGLLIDLSTHYSRIPSVKEALYKSDLVFTVLGESLYGESGVYMLPTVKEAASHDIGYFIREDIVRTLLDGEFSGSDSTLGGIYIEPYMPRAGSVSVSIVGENGELCSLVKDYSKSGNIIDLYKMFGVGKLTGKAAVFALRSYIDQAYNGYYAERRSDLFLGRDAAYDADELAALMICAVANKDMLFGEGESASILADKDSAVKAFASLYGVRGLGRDECTYVGADGELYDCREEAEAYELLGRINDWIKTGILTLGGNASEPAAALAYFGEYSDKIALSEMLPPIARWYSGENMDGKTDLGSYFRFAESAESTEDTAIAISKKGTVTSSARRECALALLEYACSNKGRELFLKSYDKEKIADLAKEQGISAEEILKDYYGAGAAFYSPSLPRKLGADEEAIDISDAYDLGLIKWADAKRSEGKNWYTEPPKLLPYTSEEYNKISCITELAQNPTENTFGYGKLEAGIIENGLLGAGYLNGGEVVNYIKNAWKISEYKELITGAHYRLSLYYYEYKNGVEY